MKKYTFLILIASVAAASASYAGYAYAALVPSLSISPITGGSSAQVTVFGADPNVSVMLYYPSSSSVSSANIGTTNGSGYLTTTVNAATEGIVSGASVYVMVDGQASQTAIWPSYTSSGSLPLSQNNVVVSIGQNSVVTASVSASLSLSENSNPSIAGASVNGNQITITGIAQGTTNITVCAGSIGCSTIYVTVQSSGSSGSPTISFGENNVSTAVGQSQTIPISGSGNYYISSNSNAGFASASLNGSTLTVSGINPGSSTVNVCSSTNGSSICGSVNVTVTQTSTAPASTAQSQLSFSPSNVDLTVGQTQTVSIYGGVGTYYVSNNPGSASVTANVNGTSVSVTGVSYGGSNVTVCSVNTQCGNLYVYVSPNDTPVTSQSTTIPALSSFSASSNDSNGSFLGSGSVLTLSFSFDQTVNTPVATVNGSALSLSGSGSGPYTANYSVTGSEAVPIPVVLNFSNPSGSSGQAYFYVSNYSTAVPQAPAASGASAASCPAGYTCTNSAPGSSASAAVFTEYLYDGSSGSQVTALQQRLTADGLYSGPITGTFGPLTKAALIRYQAKHGLAQVGVVGPATRGLLNQGI